MKFAKKVTLFQDSHPNFSAENQGSRSDINKQLEAYYPEDIYKYPDESQYDIFLLIGSNKYQNLERVENLLLIFTR